MPAPLPGDQAAAALRAAGVPLVASVELSVHEPKLRSWQVKQLAAASSGPWVLKADGPDLTHRSERGAVVLGIAGPDQLERQVQALRDRLGDAVASLQVQSQLQPGPELLAGWLTQRSGVSWEPDPVAPHQARRGSAPGCCPARRPMPAASPTRRAADCSAPA